MRKHIRAQMIKMIVLMGCLAGLVAFAWDFVYAGMMAKIYLNGFIFGVFSFGVVMAFRNVRGLRNEELAFSALVETYNDIKQETMNSAEDPYWRHYRCVEPAFVFKRPRLLGHFFEIVYEELLRTKNLRISVVTMQNLVHGVESKLAEERSLVSYISGLLVFLGLIGAFIGLMQMVQSVGAIVGGLAISTPAGNPDAFGHLITQLQGPLSGMAVGFSSSLFGLCGSLTLGLLGRLSTQAGTVLKTDFASWLANVVQIEAGNGGMTYGNEGGIKGIISQGTATKQLADAAATMSHSLSESHKSYDKMAAILERVAKAQSDQAQAAIKSSVQMAHLVTLQEEIKGNLLRSNSHGAAMVNAKDELLRLGRSIETQLTEGFVQLATVLESYQRSQAENVQQLMSMQEQLAGHALAAPSAPQSSVQVASSPQLETAIETAVARALSQLPNLADTNLSSEQIAQIQENRIKLQAMATEGGGGNVEELRLQVQKLEESVGAGFNEVTRAMETIFTSYAEQMPRRAARSPAHHQAASGAEAPEAIEGEVQAVEPVDNEEMIRRLYSKVAEQYTPTGTDA